MDLVRMVRMVVVVVVIRMWAPLRDMLLHTRLGRGEGQPDAEDEANVEEEVLVAEIGQRQPDKGEEQDGEGEEDVALSTCRHDLGST